MMELSEVQAILKEQVRFWPNYRFDAYMHPFRGLIVAIHADLIDTVGLAARDQNEIRMICTIDRHNVPRIALRDPLTFHKWLLGELCNKAIHETVEAYQVDGAPLFNPHDPDYPELTEV